MTKRSMTWRRGLGGGALACSLLLAACAGAAAPVATPTPPATATPLPTQAATATHALTLNIERDPDVPELPFPDNPDPTQCGIPTQWGGSNNRAWLSGVYQGELVEPTVHLYDSHLRRQVVARAPHGAEVRVVLYQSNPVLDFYMVRLVGEDGESAGEGWVPGPFLSFEPVRADS